MSRSHTDRPVGASLVVIDPTSPRAWLDRSEPARDQGPTRAWPSRVTRAARGLDDGDDGQDDEHHGHECDGERREAVSAHSASGGRFRFLVHQAGSFVAPVAPILGQLPSGFKRHQRERAWCW